MRLTTDRGSPGRRLAWMLSLALVLAGCEAASSSPSAPSPPAPSTAAPEPSGEVVRDVPAGLSPGTFEAVTPCLPGAMPLDQIPADADCELASWRIDLGADGSFELVAAYGMTQPNTPGIRDGGTPFTMSGTWSGTTVVELTDPGAGPPVRFRRISDDLLHLLDRDGALMLGNAAWSFTFNRTVPAPGDGAGPAPAAAVDATGTYAGRTPCTRIVHAFTQVRQSPGCQRIKWELELSGGPADGSYVFRGTTTERRGAWRLADDAVLELDVGDGEPLRVLAADAEHLYVLDENGVPLVGDALLSYTLSRIDAQ